MTRWVVVVVLLALAATPAAASGTSWGLEAWLSGATAVTTPTDRQWKGNFGVGTGVAPDYLGSADYEGVILPLVDIEWRGRYFLTTQRGLGVNLFRDRTLRAGPRITYDLGRDSGDNPFLAGLTDVDPSLEAGFFFELYRGNWRYTGDLRNGITDGHDGLLGSFGVAVGGRISERASLIFGGDLTWMDSDYVQAYFGVLAGQAASGRPAFEGTAGVRDVSGRGTLVYNINPTIYVSLDARVNWFIEPVDSPLVQDPYQFFGGAILGYRF